MRNVFIPALIASAIGLSGAAFAADTTATGKIKSIDQKAMSITLDNGKSYQLPKGFKLEGFKIGEKVSVLWSEVGGKYEASQVKMAG